MEFVSTDFVSFLLWPVASCRCLDEQCHFLILKPLALTIWSSSVILCGILSWRKGRRKIVNWGRAHIHEINDAEHEHLWLKDTNGLSRQRIYLALGSSKLPVCSLCSLLRSSALRNLPAQKREGIDGSGAIKIFLLRKRWTWQSLSGRRICKNIFEISPVNATSFSRKRNRTKKEFNETRLYKQARSILPLFLTIVQFRLLWTMLPSLNLFRFWSVVLSKSLHWELHCYNVIDILFRQIRLWTLKCSDVYS